MQSHLTDTNFNYDENNIIGKGSLLPNASTLLPSSFVGLDNDELKSNAGIELDFGDKLPYVSVGYVVKSADDKTGKLLVTVTFTGDNHEGYTKIVSRDILITGFKALL